MIKLQITCRHDALPSSLPPPAASKTEAPAASAAENHGASRGVQNERGYDTDSTEGVASNEEEGAVDMALGCGSAAATDTKESGTAAALNARHVVAPASMDDSRAVPSVPRVPPAAWSAAHDGHSARRHDNESAMVAALVEHSKVTNGSCASLHE